MQRFKRECPKKKDKTLSLHINLLLGQTANDNAQLVNYSQNLSVFHELKSPKILGLRILAHMAQCLNIWLEQLFSRKLFSWAQVP